MVYGGTIRAGCSTVTVPSAPSNKGKPLDIVSAFQSYGQYLQDGRSEDAELVRKDVVRHACPGPGACGGVSISMFETPETHVPHFRCTQLTLWRLPQKLLE